MNPIASAKSSAAIAMPGVSTKRNATSANVWKLVVEIEKLDPGRRAAHDEAPKLMHVGLYSDTGTARKPAVWLADIAALRRAGRHSEAAAEMRRFRIAYPNYIIPSEE